VVTQADNPVHDLTAYDLAHLVAHMAEAEDWENVHRLLQLETTSRRNAWFEAREAYLSRSGYLEDLQRAWQVAETAYQPEERAQTGVQIGRIVRYALVQASLNSLSGKLPPELPALLVDEGLWSWEHALAITRQILEPERKALALAELLTRLPESQKEPALRLALEAARDIEDKIDHAMALAALGPEISRKKLHKALDQALDVLAKDGAYGERTAALAKLAPTLTKRLLKKALKVAKALGGETAEALSILVPYLPEKKREEIVRQILDLLPGEGDHRWRNTSAQILARLAPDLDSNEIQIALDLARTLDANTGYQAAALLSLAPHLSSTQRDQITKEALNNAGEVLKKAKKPGWLDYRWQPNYTTEQEMTTRLVSLAPYLPEYLVGDVLEIIDREGLFVGGGEVVAALAPKLSPGRLASLLDQVQSGRNISDTAGTLVSLLPYLAPEQKRPTLQAALRDTLEIDDLDDLVAAQVELAGNLSLVHKERVLNTAGEQNYINARVRNLYTLAKVLPADLLEKAIEIARETGDEWGAIGLALIAPHLPPPRCVRVAEEAQRKTRRNVCSAAIGLIALLHAHLLADPHSRRTQIVFANLLKQMPKKPKKGRCYSYPERSKALAGLIPQLPEQWRQEVLRLELDITLQEADGEELAVRLAALAPYLPAEWLGDTLAAAAGIQDDWWRFQALLSLAPYVPRELSSQAQDAASKLGSQEDRVLVQAALAANHTSIQFEAVLAATRDLPAGEMKFLALAFLAHRGMGEREQIQLMLEALAALLEGGTDFSLITSTHAALREISSSLSNNARQELTSFLKTGLRQFTESSREELLEAIGVLEPVICSLGGGAAVEETFQALRDVGQWWP
jgi:hypothetical protein